MQNFYAKFSIVLFTGLLILNLKTFGANISSTAAGGNWNATTSWVGGVVPGAADNVTIVDGATVTVTASSALCTNLTVGGGTSGILNVGGFIITVTGTTTVMNGASLNITSATAAKTFADVTINSGGIWNNSGSSAVTITGSITNNGTFTSGTGTYTLSGAAKTVSGSTSPTTFGGAVAMSGTYTNNISTLTITGVLSGAGGLTMGTSTTLNLIGATTTITTLTCTTNTPNTVVYQGTAAQSMKNTTTTYYNLTINPSAGITVSQTVAGNTVNNNLSVLSGTFADAGFQVTGNATGTFSVAAGATYTTTRTATPWFPTAFTAGNISFANTSTFNYAGTIAHNIPTTPVTTYGILGITGAVTKTLAAATTVYGIAINTSAGILADGGFQITGNASGTITAVAGSGLTLGTAATATSFPTNFVNANITLNATSTVTYNSNLAQTISNVPTYGALATVATAAVTKTLAGNTVLVGSLNNGTNNTLDIAGFNLTIGGSLPAYTNNGTLTANAPTSTLTFNGTANQSFTVGTYTGSIISNYVCANTSSTTYNTIASALTVGNLTVNASCFMQVNSGNTLSITKDFVNNGTFITSTTTSVVSMIGSVAQTISGSGTFTAGSAGRIYNLTINNTSGSNPAVNLNLNVAIANGLNLTTGILGGTGTLTIGVAATSVTTTRNAGSLANVPTWGYTTGAYAITYNGGAAINTDKELPSSATPTNGVLTVSTAGTNVTLTADANIGTLTTSVATTTTFNLNGFTLGLSLATTINNTGVLIANSSGSTLKTNGTVAQTLTIAGTNTGGVDNLIVATTTTPTTTLGGSIIVNNLTINAGSTFSLGAAGYTLSLTGSYINNGTLNAASSSILQFTGSSNQSFAVGTYTSSTIFNFKLNGTGGVTLGAPVNATTLTLTQGNLTSTSTFFLTVTGTTAANVSGGSSTTYVNGPLARTFPASLVSGSTFNWPVGKSAFQQYVMTNPTTSAGGTVVIKVEVYDANAGGTSGAGVGALNTNRYWNASITSGSANLTSSGKIGLTETGIVNGTDHVTNSSTQTGSYSIYSSTVTSGVVTTVNAGPIGLGYFVIGKGGTLSGSYTVGTSGQFQSLTNGGGLFDVVNAGTVTGNLTITINSDLSAETGSVPLYQWTESPASSNFTMLIQSDGTARTISGSYNGAGISTNGLVRFDGADRVTISGGSSTQRLLTFRNTNTAGTQNATLHFLDDVTTISVYNCIFEGGETSNTNGVIYFGTTIGTNGNDNITIDNCDIRDLTTTTAYPDNCIYALGNTTALGYYNSTITISNCNIFNFYHASSDNNGILVNGGNAYWTISGNSVYQLVSRALTANESDGIQIATNANGLAFTISNNYVGGSAANAGGSAWTMTGSGVFRGIRCSVASSPVSEIQGNTIKNISITSTSTSTVQSGISLATGGFNCGNTTPNNIGVQNSTGSIVCSISGAGSVFSGINAGSGTPGTMNISNNLIGGISLSSGSTFRGIYTQGAGVYTVSGNTIGSSSTANSISNSGNSATVGIYSTGSSSSNTFSTNNIINLTGTGSNASAQVIGISLQSAALGTVSGNIIYNLSNANPNVGVKENSGVIGIVDLCTTASAQQIISNQIYGLSNTGTGAVGIIGICLSPFASSSPTYTVEKNIIHSFSTTSTTAFQYGINISTSSLSTPVATIKNNMIRLGIDASGSSVTTSASIVGINKNIAANSNIVFNSVYIGGSSVASGTVNTYAFQRLLTGTDEIRDNIFVNSRSNTSGTGSHFAYGLNATTTATSDYNIYYAPGTGGAISSVAGTTYTLQGLRATVSGQDLHSGNGDPNYLSPNGSSFTINLHLNSATPAEGTGVTTTTSVTDDYDGTTRSTVTPIDIGADAGNFNTLVASTDIFTPTISYTAITNQASCASTVTLSATISDVGVGVPTSGANVPRIYFRRSSPSASSWASAAGTLQSGNGTSGTWSFVIDYSLLSLTPTTGEVYQYYVVAQDQATNPSNPNIWFSKFDATTPVFTNNNVNTPSTHPASPDSYTIVTGISGTVYVGTGAGTPSYATFNGASGLFTALNNGVLIGDLTVIVQNNVTETTTTGLNQLAYSCGGPYKVTVQPDGTTTRIVSGSVSTALIQMSGADSVTFDGNFSGAGRYLRFQNQNGAIANTAATFYLTNDSKRITVKNCEVEGYTSNQSSGVVYIGAGTTTGNDYFTLNNCLVHEKTAGAGTGYPIQLIYSNGSASATNDNETISNNYIYNWSSSGGGTGGRNAIALNVTSTGNGSNWTITGNSFYNQFIDGAGYQDGITFTPGSSSNGNVISNNYIGGSKPLCDSLSAAIPNWRNNYDDGFSTNNEIDILTLDCGTITVSGNTIKRVQNSNSDNSGVVGIWLKGSTSATVSSNTFGDPVALSNRQLSCGGGGWVSAFAFSPGYVYGIYTSGSAAITLSSNNFYYLYQYGAYTGGSVFGISHTSSGACSITNNNFTGIQCSGIGYDAYCIKVVPSAALTGITITGNKTDGPYILDVTGSYNTTTGIFVGSTTVSTSGTISNNRVYDLRNPAYDGQVQGIWLTGTGSWDVNNNQISLGNYFAQDTTNNVGIFGLEDDLSYGTGSSANYYYNSVIIGGQQGAGDGFGFDHSAAFIRQPGQTGTVAGDLINLKNNIFINNRTGGTGSKHWAIANYGTSNYATNWSSSAANYNFLGSRSASTLGRWGSTDLTFTNWQTSSSGDANSWNLNTVASGSSSLTQLNPYNLFTNLRSGNLNIYSSNSACWFVNGKGVAGSASGSIATDYGGGTRGTTYGYATDIGSNEFNASTGTYPIAVTATPAFSSTNTFTFAGRTIGSITWGATGTVPTSVAFEYYSGDLAGTNPSPSFPGGYNQTDFTYHITATGGSGYTYNVSLYYDDADKGDFASVAENTMMLIKTNASNNWITRTTQPVDVVNNIVTANGLNDFSYFTGSDGNLLPIVLTSFTAEPYHVTDALLTWKTASEVNNDHFDIEVATSTNSYGELQFRKIGEVAGHGTSNHENNYNFIDKEAGKIGIRYYRLKQIDLDGKYSYSQIKTVMFDGEQLNAGPVYPNPTFDEIFIPVVSSTDMKLTVSVYSITGQLLFNSSHHAELGESKIHIDASSLSSGIYLVKILDENGAILEVRRFEKQ